MELDSDNAEVRETVHSDTAEQTPVVVVKDSMGTDSVAADLDSRPLNDLGVSVMEQDVLERNVAAQVSRLFRG